jgi:hypothetical protein
VVALTPRVCVMLNVLVITAISYLIFTELVFALLVFVCVSAAAALALMDQPHLSAEDVVRKAMKIAGDICVYTNHNVTLELLPKPEVAGESISATAATGAVAGSLNSPSSPAAVGNSAGSMTAGSAPLKASTLAGIKFY